MLYTKSRDQLSWDDIEAFCQQGLPEGAYLDYKQDFPAHLEQIIAAMANTFGGIILIGVAVDDENKPKMPLSGIPFKRGLEERAMNIILDNITPPVFPEVIPVRDTSGQSAIVLIRVPQSDQTPHAIASNTKVYLRTGNRNKPETLATIDQIEWLRDRRLKSEELRVRLYKRANERFNALYHRQIRELEQIKGLEDPDLGIAPTSLGLLTLSLCPLYPKDFLRTPPEMSKVYNEIKIDDYYGTHHFYGARPVFPPSDLRNRAGKIVQDGVVLVNLSFEGERFFYTELNCFGLYFYRQHLEVEESQHGGRSSTSFLASEMVCRLDEFFDSAVKYYEIMGYWGLLQFGVELSGIPGCGLSLDWLQDRRFSPNLSPDPEVQLTEVVLAGALETEKRRLILQLVQRVTWAFGWDVTQEDLEKFYMRFGR